MQGSGTTTADDPGGLIEVGGVLIRAVVSDEAMEKAFRVDKTNQAPKRVMRRPVLTNKEACDRRNLERAMLENLRSSWERTMARREKAIDQRDRHVSEWLYRQRKRFADDGVTAAELAALYADPHNLRVAVAEAQSGLIPITKDPVHPALRSSSGGGRLLGRLFRKRLVQRKKRGGVWAYRIAPAEGSPAAARQTEFESFAAEDAPLLGL